MYSTAARIQLQRMGYVLVEYNKPFLGRNTAINTWPCGIINTVWQEFSVFRLSGQKAHCPWNNIPYSWKYWWELNLAVEPKIAIARIL